MVQVECVVDGCDYEGSLQSVMNHITASGQDGHKGEQGQNYMEELREEAENVLSGPLQQAGASVVMPGEQESDPESEPAEQESEPAERATAPAAGAAAAAAPAAVGAGLFRSGDGVNWKLVGAVVLLGLLLYMMYSGGEEESAPSTEPKQESGPSTPTEAVEQRGGLSE